MAVICFIDGGMTDVARFAARQLSSSAERNGSRIGYLSCDRSLSASSVNSQSEIVNTVVSGRELIAEIKRLQGGHDHIVLDASGMLDQTIALAVALSDFVLTPLSLDKPDDNAFIHATDLVRIVAGNSRRSVKHCVFLTSRRRSAMTAMTVQISGLLALKGLVTVPISLREPDCEAGQSSEGKDMGTEAGNPAFAYSVFDLVDRQFTPVAKQQHFG